MARLSWTELAHPLPGQRWAALRREVDQLFARVGHEVPHGVHPPVNLYESADGFVLTAELPGMKLADI